MFKINSYISGVTKPTNLTDRLSVIYWKTGKDGVKKESKCVSIPMIGKLSIEQLQSLEVHCRDLLLSAQNKIIRESIENGNESINPLHITIEECIKYLDSTVTSEDGTSNRLTKELLINWFETNIADRLMIALAEKMKINIDSVSESELKQIDSVSSKFKSEVCKLASGAVKLDVRTSESVKKALMLWDEVQDDVIGSKLVAKLDGFISKPVENELYNVL